ncbi:MAG: cytochrome c [Mariprofundales bacterium]
MKYKLLILAMVASFGLLGVTASASASDDGIDSAKLFKKKCSMCHAIDRKKMGPSVKSMNTDSDVLHTVITKGRKSMPKFGKKLGEEKISALVDYIKSQHLDNE